ncbi:cobalamin adenosyltransferase, partial [Klebsiella pneumoniae]
RDALKRYRNRLSDALFSMARIEETRPDACA